MRRDDQQFEARHQELLDAATAAVERAYSPYSKFRVGAAVLTADGEIHTGCNVENASYGLTVCAERVAIFNAVAASTTGKPNILAIAIVTDPPDPAAPCGACRQVLLEFGPDAVVSFLGDEGRREMTVRELLPVAFELEGPPT